MGRLQDRSNTLSGGSAVIFQYNTVTAALTTVYTNGIYALPYGDDFYGPEMTPDGRFLASPRREQADQHQRQHPFVGFPNRHQFVGQHQCQRGVFRNTLSQAAAVTPDGHYVVFLSNAGDLTANAVSNGFAYFPA